MPTINEWLGRAGGVSQVVTLTASGAGTGAGTLNVTVGPKTVGVAVANTMTAATFAANLYAALAAAADPEVQDSGYAYTAAGVVVTATGRTPGQPLAIMVGGPVTNNGITLTPATATAATGPNDAANALNWSQGHVPAGGELALIRDPSSAVLYGIGTAFAACTLLDMSAGVLGLPDRNPAGYYEFRDRRAVLAAAVARLSGTVSRCRVSFNVGGATVVVTGSGGPADAGELAAVDVDAPAGNDLAALQVTGGSVQFNRDGGGAKPGAVHVTAAGTLVFANAADLGAANADIDGGTVSGELTASGGAVVNVSAGSVSLTGPTNLPKIHMTGGTLAVGWTQVGALELQCTGSGGGTRAAPSVDARNAPGPLTLSATSFFLGGSKLLDPGNQVTFTTTVQFDGPSLAESDLGNPVLVTR